MQQASNLILYRPVNVWKPAREVKQKTVSGSAPSTEPLLARMYTLVPYKVNFLNVKTLPPKPWTMSRPNISKLLDGTWASSVTNPQQCHFFWTDCEQHPLPICASGEKEQVLPEVKLLIM